ncbi:putative N-lysine methyltransferase setd6 [Hypsibius exemplaris]|uniref:N-lysine methyltransferase n=1 Tax=Hypsibius exemplaris TaxID=2072580 RepID=A0A1W0WQL9_HYPEX|nr:putative N-lysine methyltransferase setd6 [Hypsibius exemplaris]
MSERRPSSEEPETAKRVKTQANNGSNNNNGFTSGGDNYDLLTNRIDRDDGKLAAFVRWCVDLRPAFTISKKVYMGIRGSAANYGMIAVEDIEPGEEIFRIPIERTLSWENLIHTNKLRPEIEKMAVASRWTPIILAIMLEDGVENSRWSEYLRLFLRSNELSIPLLWEQDALINMQGLNIAQRVAKDRAQIASDFKNWVFPVLMRELQLNESSFDILLNEAYRVAAFVMSYSFTRPQPDDDEKANDENAAEDADESDGDEEATTAGNALAEVPLMIPIADILNASVHKNNAKLHWNEDDGKFLSMLCTKPIAAGEEVFNTYGEISSEEMLYLYGYAEEGPPNPHEEVFIPSEYIKDVIYHAATTDGASVEQRWEYLLKRKVVGSDMPVVLGTEGVLTDEDLHLTVRVLTMSNDEFESYAQNGEHIEDEPLEEGLFALEKLRSLPTAVKLILKLLVQRKLRVYPQSQQEYEEAANTARDIIRSDVGEDMARRGINVALARRSFYVAYVRMRQTQILNEYYAKLA